MQIINVPFLLDIISYIISYIFGWFFLVFYSPFAELYFTTYTKCLNRFYLTTIIYPSFDLVLSAQLAVLNTRVEFYTLLFKFNIYNYFIFQFRPLDIVTKSTSSLVIIAWRCWWFCALIALPLFIFCQTTRYTIRCTRIVFYIYCTVPKIISSVISKAFRYRALKRNPVPIYFLRNFLFWRFFTNRRFYGYDGEAISLFAKSSNNRPCRRSFILPEIDRYSIC